MSRRAALAALPVALLACATSRIPPLAPEPPAAPPARAEFLPPDGEAVFQQAVRAMVRDGYPLKLCDAGRLRIRTSRVELDAPCGATTCLARQTVEVKLGYRVARVSVAREVYDGAERRWRSDGEGSADAARELLARIVESPRLERRPNPCAPAARLELAGLGAPRPPAIAAAAHIPR